LIGGNGLLQLLQPKLQLVGAQLLRAATELVTNEALDQQPQLVVLGVQFAVLQQHRPQHLLQYRGVIREGFQVDLHVGDDGRRRRVEARISVWNGGLLAGKLRPADGDRRPPFASVEQRCQLRRRERDPATRRGRRPKELALL
jgi:hypothetical protein